MPSGLAREASRVDHSFSLRFEWDEEGVTCEELVRALLLASCKLLYTTGEKKKGEGVGQICACIVVRDRLQRSLTVCFRFVLQCLTRRLWARVGCELCSIVARLLRRVLEW